jgi:hypothetical protein
MAINDVVYHLEKAEKLQDNPVIIKLMEGQKSSENY